MPKSSAWLPPQRYWLARPAPAQQPWLLCEGSLTAALVRLSQGSFRVRVTHEGWHRPHADERAALRMPTRLVARIREVELLGRDEVWIKARSVIPLKTLRGKGHRLRYLGSRSLGTLLFKGRARRGPLEIRREGDCWQRHSCFRYDGRPLLVREQFLPALFEAAQAGKMR